MKSILTILLLTVTASSLGACQTMTREIKANALFCDLAEPHTFSNPAAVDALTDVEVNRELAHNEIGQKFCGWKE
jgi:hypothetical protein